jgi:hypothetical protein
MPTYIRTANAPPRSVVWDELPCVSIFFVIGLIQLAIAVLTGGQWALIGEQALF